MSEVKMNICMDWGKWRSRFVSQTHFIWFGMIACKKEVFNDPKRSTVYTLSFYYSAKYSMPKMQPPWPQAAQYLSCFVFSFRTLSACETSKLYEWFSRKSLSYPKCERDEYVMRSQNPAGHLPASYCIFMNWHISSVLTAEKPNNNRKWHHSFLLIFMHFKDAFITLYFVWHVFHGSQTHGICIAYIMLYQFGYRSTNKIWSM